MTDSPWFKLFALATVAGVAKHLFGPPPVVQPVVNQYIDSPEEKFEGSDDKA